MKEYRLTREGYEMLSRELEDLVKNKRREVAERLKEAKKFGGSELGENSEYEYAKNEQAFIEGRIEQLSEILQNCVIVDEKDRESEVVDVGSTVIVKDLDENRTKKFKLVSAVESNPETGKISDESPLGRTLLNKKIGDVVEVKTPQKIKKFKIIDIV